MFSKIVLIIIALFYNFVYAEEQTYNRLAVAKYAANWWDKNNQSYPIYDSRNKVYPLANDCANYASQLLRAGGLLDKKSSDYGRGDNRQWFYSDGNSVNRYSHTWVDVRSLYRRFVLGYENASLISDANEIYNKLAPGDLVFWFAKGVNGVFELKPHHVSVVVWQGKNKNSLQDLSVTSHTRNRKDDSLRGILEEYKGNEKIIGVKINYKTKNSKQAYSVEMNSSNITASDTGISNSFFAKFLTFLGIRDAVAQSLPSLFAYVNSDYTVRVDGTGFDGNEAVSIAGSTCNTAAIQRGSGYFTQSCTGGSAAADSNKIRVYDTTYDLDIEVPTAYQTMQLRGPILAPLAPALTEPTTGTIRLSWSAVSGATGYEVSRGGTAISTVGTTTSYDDTGRTAGTPYCYRLRTIQGGIMSASSPEACYTPATIRCAGTWNNTQYSVGATETTTQACQSGYTGNKTLSHVCQASGQWGATTTVNNCTLTPAPTCTGTWSSAKYLIGQVEEVYQNNCPAGTTGQVRSWHTCQASGSSAVWGGLSQSDNCTAYLATPTDVRTSSISSGVQITWAAVSGATSYRLYKSDTNTVYREVFGTNSYVDQHVTDGSTYRYAVSAYSNLNGQNALSPASSWSELVYRSGQVGVNPPTGVSAGQYTLYSQKGIRLQWTGASLADSYLIYRRGYENPYTSAAFLAPVGGGDISFFDIWSNFSGSIVSGRSYCYYIRSVRGSTNSTDSNEACSVAP